MIKKKKIALGLLGLLGLGAGGTLLYNSYQHNKAIAELARKRIVSDIEQFLEIPKPNDMSNQEYIKIVVNNVLPKERNRLDDIIEEFKQERLTEKQLAIATNYAVEVSKRESDWRPYVFGKRNRRRSRRKRSSKSSKSRRSRRKNRRSRY